MSALSLTERVENAVFSYCRYLGKLFWPVNLAVFYPHPRHWSVGLVLLAGLLFFGIFFLVFALRRRRPYLLVGWLWYVGTLVPVIGLVQVGGQSMADRYTYIPSLGIFVLLVWSAHELTKHWRRQRLILSAVAATAIFFCLSLTVRQIARWRDTKILFEHTIAVTENNWLANNNLGALLVSQGQTAAAIKYFEEALRIKPDYELSRFNLGMRLLDQGRLDEAIHHLQIFLAAQPRDVDALNGLGVAWFRKERVDEAIPRYEAAIKARPDFSAAHFNFALALRNRGCADEAIHQLQEAVRLNPDAADARGILGDLFSGKGRGVEAVVQFQEVVKLKPDSADARYNLANTLTDLGQLDQAVTNYHRAIELNPTNAMFRFNMGVALAGQGRMAAAMDSYRRALQINPKFEDALNNLAWALATCPEAKLRNGAEAVRLAERAMQLAPTNQPGADVLDTLAAAYAEAGNFAAATNAAGKAFAAATQAGDTTLAVEIKRHLKLYEAGWPFRKVAETNQPPP